MRTGIPHSYKATGIYFLRLSHAHHWLEGALLITVPWDSGGRRGCCLRCCCLSHVCWLWSFCLEVTHPTSLATTRHTATSNLLGGDMWSYHVQGRNMWGICQQPWWLAPGTIARWKGRGDDHHEISRVRQLWPQNNRLWAQAGKTSTVIWLSVCT